MDDASLERALQDASTALECVDERMLAEDVAAYFRAQALGYFLIGDTDRALRALWTAKLTEPTYQFPDSMAGADHPLVRMYETVAYRPSEGKVPLLPPQTGSFRINGGDDESPDFASDGRPYVFQRLNDEGAVVQTVVVSTGGRPEYPARTNAVRTLLQEDASASRQFEKTEIGHPSRGLLVASLVSGVGSVSALAAAGSLRSRYNNAGVEQGSLDGVVGTNRALGWTGVGLGASAFGLGVGAIWVGRW